MSIEQTSFLVDAYEQLRRHFVESTQQVPSLNGLAVLMRKGMAAWIHTCAAAAPNPKPLLRHDCLWPMPACVHSEIVELLASMTLASSLEVSA